MARHLPLSTACMCLVAWLTLSSFPAVSPADDDEPAAAASALTTVVPLQKGSLPTTVVVYGSAQASAHARQTIMAPASAEVGSISVRVGDRVRAGAPLLTLTPTPSSAASYTQAKSALSVATQALARTRALLQEHLATAQQLEDAQKAEGDARANLEALQAQGAGGMLTVRAPYAASVTAVSVSVGTMVSQGNPLLELVSSQGLILQAGAVPQVASTISVGNDASITPIGANQPLQGKVLMRGDVIDPATGLVPIELSFPANALLPGQQAIATVTTGQVQAYLVPHAAVLLNDEGNPYVVQVIGGVAKKVDVQVLGTQDGRDGISGALNASAPVALSGNYQLEDGMKVRTAQDAGRPAQ